SLPYTQTLLLSYSLLPLYGYHPDLHSFPTRRSSDLAVSSYMAMCPAFSTSTLSAYFAMSSIEWLTSMVVVPVSLCHVLIWPRMRSEEHTSELQSRFELVCRLLLEKEPRASWSRCRRK